MSDDKKPIRWRRWLVALHRDIGFFCLGLTVIYAVSGVAVNHRQHWDYNYSSERRVQQVGGPAALLGLSPEAGTPGELARQHQDALVKRLGELTGHEQLPRKAFWRGPQRLSLFYAEAEEDVVDYLPETGVVEGLHKTPRPLIREMNILHLNEKRLVWTWFGDAYAVALLFLALSGVLIVKGRKGLKGRGGMLVVAGILLPVLALIFMP